MRITPYSVIMNFIKNYVAEFCQCDFNFTHVFGTEKILAKINYELPEAQVLVKRPIEEPNLGYVYLKKKTNKRDFFRVLEKHLVPSKILYKIIANATKSNAQEHVKNKFHNHLKWYLEF